MKVDLSAVEIDLTVSYMSGITAICRVPTNTGNHGKPGKLPQKKFHAWKNHGIKKN